MPRTAFSDMGMGGKEQEYQIDIAFLVLNRMMLKFPPT